MVGVQEDSPRELLDRLDRIEQAIALGLADTELAAQPAVSVALVDTVLEAVRVCHRVTLLLADGDLWADLPLICALWARLDAIVTDVSARGPEMDGAAAVIREVGDDLRGIMAVNADLEEGLAELARHPRDRAACARVDVAIGELQDRADRHFVAAVDAHGEARLDQALSVLTAATARTARARATRDQLVS